MSILEGVSVEVSVALGSTNLPIRQILKMGRGAMIPLDCGQDDPSLVYVNDQLVAKGEVMIDGDHLSLNVTEIVRG